MNPFSSKALDALRERLTDSQVTVVGMSEGISAMDTDENEVRFRIEA